MDEIQNCFVKEQRSQVRFEKEYIQQLRCDSPADSIPLYVEEKGPTTAKAHGGTSWPPVQVKVDGLKRQREALNVLRL